MAVSSRQVLNRRDADGKLTGRAGTVYDVNIKYKTPEGIRKTYSKKGFPTKKEALQYEAQMRLQLQNPVYAGAMQNRKKQTVCCYLDNWLESYVRLNLRPSTYDSYKTTARAYIVPYIGGVLLDQLTPPMVDYMFQRLLEKGLKPGTVAEAKRVLNVAMGHAKKYQYITMNPVRDTITKFPKQEKTPDPYTVEQMNLLLSKTLGTQWEMPVMLGGLYGMRRSEILGLRWRNVDLENRTFDVVEQLPFGFSSKEKRIADMAPPKSNGRKLPITDQAYDFFVRQRELQSNQRQQQFYYDNDLVVAREDGAPVSPRWISSGFGGMVEGLGFPRIRFHDLRHTAATNMHELTGEFYTVGEILGHTLPGIGATLGISINFDVVTARYVEVRLDRKQEVLMQYHNAVWTAGTELEKKLAHR